MDKHRTSDEFKSAPLQYASEVHPGTKAIDRIKKQMSEGQRFFSFEFYPPRTETGVSNLKLSLSRMVQWQPQWMDVTWGAGGTTSELTPELCDYIQNTIGGNCMMHLTCTNMDPDKVDVALTLAKQRGFKNILALRGDPPHGQKEWKAVEGGFECALDLITYIRKGYGDHFGITVSGYPEGHPVVRKQIEDPSWSAETNDNPRYHAVKQCADGSYEGVSEEDWRSELDYLKRKIEAGGQVIITQLFYDAQIFIEWVHAVRAHGIDAPILPGIMPIRNYGSFGRMTGFCKTVIPKALSESLEKLKGNADELYAFGADYVRDLCVEVLSAKDKEGQYLVPGLHIYTMDTEKCTIELLAKCKEALGMNEHLSSLIDSELKRVLAEDQRKRMEKKKKEEEKMKLLLEASPVEQGKFKEVNSF